MNGTEAGTIVADRTTDHKVYTVLSVPSALPWKQHAGDPCNVWSKALELVCGNDWAGGATTTKDAARLITHRLYGTGVYPPDGGRKRLFNEEGDLRLTFALEQGCACGMNCEDVAALVSSLGNALGCDNKTIELSRSGGFDCNQVWPLPGTGFPSSGWTSDSLGFHVVTGGTDGVFDGCYGFRYEGQILPLLRCAVGLPLAEYHDWLVPANHPRPEPADGKYPSVR